MVDLVWADRHQLGRYGRIDCRGSAAAAIETAERGRQESSEASG